MAKSQRRKQSGGHSAAGVAPVIYHNGRPTPIVQPQVTGNGHGANGHGFSRAAAAAVLAERQQALGGQDLPAAPPATTTAVKLSVVIPMFNEEENLKNTVDRLAETLRAFKDGAWEVVLVNDGSTDATWACASELAARPPYAGWLRVVGYSRNRGRGYALRTGFAAARGEWITSTDADLSYEPRYILDLVKVLREEDDVDMVIASAYMPGGGVEGLDMKRLFVSKFGNKVLSWFMSPPKGKVHTITCVFRAYRRYVLDSLDLESDSKDIHLEILSKAIMLGYNFKEVPVTLRTRKKGKSKHVFMPTATSHLVFALFERPILVFGLVGIMLVLASFLGMAWMIKAYLQQTLNPARPMMTIIVLTFLGGIQLLSFGVIGTQFVNLRKEIIKIQARLKALAQRQPED